jgi:hypothetical protein
MTLNKRETRILWVTISMIGGLLLWTQGVGPLYDKYVQLQDSLAKEQKKYQDNVKILSTADKIEADYKRIEAQFPKEVEGKSPEHQFSEDVVAAAAQILPDKVPSVDIVQHEAIKEINDYEFLTFAAAITGELDKISQLLKGFDQKGFLIKMIKLAHTRGPDSPELKLEITLARIVKIAEDEFVGGPRRPGTVKFGGRRK